LLATGRALHRTGGPRFMSLSNGEHARSRAPAQGELGRKRWRRTSRDTWSRRSAEQLALDALASRLCTRDVSAFGDLYDLTVERVFTLAMFLLRNRADADDIVSDVYVNAWNRIESYDPARGDLLAWLLTMCRSRAIDAMREQRTRVRVSEAYHRDQLADGAGDAEPLLEMLQPQHAVTEALTDLSPLRREVLGLAFCRGLTHGEIAVELSLPLGSVKSHLRRAIAQVRSAVSGDTEGTSP
jgi:RNA polymerase sigma factor (sigma-70 family)